MTGTDKIKSKILEDARAHASEIEEQAKREAQEIMEKASVDAEQKRAEILGKAEQDGQEVYRRLLSVAGLENRKEVLRAKQDIVEAAFQGALDKVVNLPDREYQTLIEDLIVSAAVKGSGEILLSEKDRKRMDKGFLKNINNRLKKAGAEGNLTLSKDTICSSGGFVIKSGDMEINGTLEILIGMLRPKLENEVVEILFDN
jgi:V/A-type H+-transporting ATPase subunit E